MRITFQQDFLIDTARADLKLNKCIWMLEGPSQSLNPNAMENLWQDWKIDIHGCGPSI